MMSWGLQLVTESYDDIADAWLVLAKAMVCCSDIATTSKRVILTRYPLSFRLTMG